MRRFRVGARAQRREKNNVDYDEVCSESSEALMFFKSCEQPRPCDQSVFSKHARVTSSIDVTSPAGRGS
ncbi:unnamed protein product [Danaus chrysippus]|uniref:(African queen) hypothetical protein n=1 Tax=Danaus chrysippus TaxID=151541 RepID=A0A8J2WB32_9NEOP|nr:unnamed protein product [Danaus chrysippus]